MFNDKVFTDVVFNVQGVEFQAHKSVLAIRSPVFYKAFTVDMIEKKKAKLTPVILNQMSLNNC